ncbi:MAG: tRNA pseudouridine(38-40) synthase TruA [Candidatus Krumholzibacteriota bacterium]|nr:tRNA pseudouridine(38-40) synthase TruA [Candidatus Krumholzibacteriota bacterium]
MTERAGRGYYRMRNFKLILEYDGGDFSGWQVQPHQRTVQGELFRALAELEAGEMKITGAGRTDAGVHATGQVANVLIDIPYDIPTLRNILDARLPRDILIRKLEEVPLSFNARFDARRRTYHYIFVRRPTALWRKYYFPVEGELDLAAMRGALEALPGEHDFASFASSGGGGSTRCRIFRAELIDNPPLLILSLTADRFLYKMVRAIAGTLLQAGRGETIKMKGILAARDRGRAGKTLPPHALYLTAVEY